MRMTLDLVVVVLFLVFLTLSLLRVPPWMIPWWQVCIAFCAAKLLIASLP